MSLLEVRDLRVGFNPRAGRVQAVDGLSFSVDAGEALGIVGESGAGKSQTALAVLGLLGGTRAQVSGSIRFEGRELLGLREAALTRIRGNRIAMVFQDPMTSLNPYLRVGRQIEEVLERHRGMSRRAAAAESLRLLDAVHIPDAARRLHGFPHELSGGQRQRVMIAMALACRPALLLADEPTTALDVTVQAQILRLFGELRREFGLAIVLITHDLGLVAELCERTLVMYAGGALESGPTRAVLGHPLHPYSRALLDARPRLDVPIASRLRALPGQPPDLTRLPPGCVFAPRCPIAEARCSESRPPLRTFDRDRAAACHRAEIQLTDSAVTPSSTSSS